VKGSPSDLQVRFIGNLLPAMRKHGVKRLVSLTGAGVADPNDRPKPINHLIKFLLKTLNPEVLADGERHAELIRNSGLEWVLVRGPMLTDAPARGRYRVGYAGVNTGMRIPRADLASFMLRQAHEDDYLGKAPMVTE
jgi:nucleoside-diphosphate-sugar epimerase